MNRPLRRRKKIATQKGIGTRFEMREVVFTFLACPSDLSEKLEKKLSYGESRVELRV